MSSDEGMSMAKMAVTVLLVVLVIGAVVGIVYAAYSWFNSGTDKLSDNVSSISDTALSQYDDCVVHGDDVLAALKNFRNSEYTVLISNLKNQGNTYSQTPKSVDAMAYCALPTGFQANKTANVKYNEIGGTSLGSQYNVDGLLYKDDAVVPQVNTNFSPTTTKSNKDAFVKKSAQWYSNLVYDNTTGDIVGVIFRQMN